MKLKLHGFESSLILLCTPQFKVEELILPTNNRDWQTWLNLAQLNRIETQVYNQSVRNSLALPDFVVEPLKARAEQVIAQNRKRREEVQLLFNELNASDINFVVLKGNALAQELYDDLDYKQMNDFDLLFRSTDLDRLYEVYQKLGYVSAASLSADFRKQEKYSHHWPPFFSRSLHLFLGTHWNIVSPLTKIKVPESFLWDETEDFVFGENVLKRLSKQKFLLHLCVHLSPYKLGLKELSDLYNFVFAFEDQIRWQEFLKNIYDLKAQDAVYRAFSLLNSIFDSPRVAQVCLALRPSVSTKVLSEIEHRTQPAIKILWTRTSHISKIEKNFGLFTLTDKPSEKAYFLAKMWKHYLWPSREESFRICHELSSSSRLVRLQTSLLAVWRISQSFCHELGAKVFILVTIDHHIQLVKSCLSRLKNGSCEGLREKAHRLGLNFEDIVAATQLE